MVDKVFGQDFANETAPTSSMTISVNTGVALKDVELQYLYKALGAAATQALLDLISTTQGAILYYNGTDWVALSPGTSGQFLKTQGAGANPTWATAGGGSNSIMDGRLTLATGVPVTTTNQTGKTTVYLTPYLGNKIALYDGSAWNVRTLTEISVAVPSTTNTPFDVFCYDNAGTPTLETVNWTNDTTRATALTKQDGVYVKSGAATRRYIGTCRTTGVSGQTEDSTSVRFVWNYYNRVPRDMYALDTTNSWTYTTAAWRPQNNNTTDGVGRNAFVVGVSEEILMAFNYGMMYNTSQPWGGVGIGIDSTTVNSARTYGGAPAATPAPVTASYNGIVSEGYHYVQKLEGCDAVGTTTWYGDAGSTWLQFGLTAQIRG